MTSRIPKPVRAVHRRLRATFPDRRVVRNVQGVRLVLPWEHKLPYYAKLYPHYGQNLVELARLLGSGTGPFGVVDIGANVGDSALQILAATDARIVCVEADEHWLKYLHANVDQEPRITVAPVFLSTSDQDAEYAPVRDGGTTRFETVASDQRAGPAILNPQQLKDAYADIGSVRLIKSDTDGFDTRIVPRAAQTWSDDRPVLFFEFDPGLTRQAGEPDPGAVWQELAAIGYREFALWDNFGLPLGMISLADIERAQAVLDRPFEKLGYHYWDVAAFHDADEAGRRAVTGLVPMRFPVDSALGS